MGPDQKFIDKVAKMDDEALAKLRGALISREETRRVKFSRSRSVKDGDALRKTRAELGHVRTQISIRKPVSG